MSSLSSELDGSAKLPGQLKSTVPQGVIETGLQKEAEANTAPVSTDIPAQASDGDEAKHHSHHMHKGRGHRRVHVRLSLSWLIFGSVPTTLTEFKSVSPFTAQR